MFVWHPPVLSDDLYRYLFDGLMTLQGQNPYALAPLDAGAPGPALKALLPLVNHGEMVTIYPPAAQAVFAAGAAAGRLAGMVPGMKLVLVAMDCGSCILILALLKCLRLPAHRAVLYAWNPLPVIETGSSGHIDAAAVLFLFAALVLTLRARTPVLAAFFMAMSILTKWMPLIFFPAWFLLVRPPERAAALATCIGAGSCLTLMFWPEVSHGMTSLGVYLAHWEFSGFVFRVLREMTGSGTITRALLAIAMAGTVGAGILRQWRSHRPPEEAAMACMATAAAAYLILSPTVYPWYALYLAAFLPFIPAPAGLVFTWSLLLSYRILITVSFTGQWAEESVTPALVIAAPAGAAAAAALFRSIKRRSLN